MDTITLRDLEVHYHIGVPDEERVHPQRLLISVEMETDIRPAAAGDDLAHTINYYAVSQRLLGLGRGRSWRLIETLVSEIADLWCSGSSAHDGSMWRYASSSSPRHATSRSASRDPAIRTARVDRHENRLVRAD